MKTPLLLLMTLVATPSMDAAAKPSFVELRGTPVRYQVNGSGKSIILVHGWTCDASSWQPQIASLSQHYRVITLDLPGHGNSGLPATALSIALFAEAVESVRQATNTAQAVLIGHSMGVYVVREYAEKHPSRVAGLIAVDGILDGAALGDSLPKRPGFMGDAGLQVRKAMIEGMLTPGTPVWIRSHVSQMMLRTSEVVAEGAAIASWEWLEQKRAAIRVPVLAIYAQPLPNLDEGKIKQTIPQYESIHLADSGHFVMLEQPGLFDDKILGFLSRIGY